MRMGERRGHGDGRQQGCREERLEPAPAHLQMSVIWLASALAALRSDGGKMRWSAGMVASIAIVRVSSCCGGRKLALQPAGAPSSAIGLSVTNAKATKYSGSNTSSVVLPATSTGVFSGRV